MAYTTGFEEFFWVDSGGAWPNSGTATTFTTPANVYWIWVVGVAGGGGGGSSVKFFAVDGGGGGGGSGESVEGLILATYPKQQISITVGGGGDAGLHGVTSYNVNIGPEGNTSFGSSGWGGEDTIIGPVRLKGGYGGLSGSTGHSGMGGGVGSGTKGGNAGTTGSTAVTRSSGVGGAGYTMTNKYLAKWWGGSGGGSGSYANNGFTPGAGGDGGPLGPHSGGVGGSVTSTLAGGGAGGGGGASIFGPGGAGGSELANAPAVPSTSYGAGGGGGGGNNNTNLYGGATIDAWLGAAGKSGYAAIFWITDDSTTYTLRPQPGFFTLTGNAVTFNYP